VSRTYETRSQYVERGDESALRLRCGPVNSELWLQIGLAALVLLGGYHGGMWETYVPGETPGLFVTGTDTGVGKTLVSCAIARALRGTASKDGPLRIGVSKPLASGCRREREGLVNEDAEALAHFADCREPLEVINPLRFAPPLAPAVAAAEARDPAERNIDWPSLWRSLGLLDERSDVMLVEGVGGLLVPLDPDDLDRTALWLIRTLGYPAVVVARSVLGTLNHTAMTVSLLRAAGCRIAGIVMNGYDADVAVQEDPSVSSNRLWIEKMTGLPVLAVVPRLEPDLAGPHQGVIGEAALEAIARVDWRGLADTPKPVT